MMEESERMEVELGCDACQVAVGRPLVLRDVLGLNQLADLDSVTTEALNDAIGLVRADFALRGEVGHPHVVFDNLNEELKFEAKSSISFHADNREMAWSRLELWNDAIMAKECSSHVRERAVQQLGKFASFAAVCANSLMLFDADWCVLTDSNCGYLNSDDGRDYRRPDVCLGAKVRYFGLKPLLIVEFFRNPPRGHALASAQRWLHGHASLQYVVSVSFNDCTPSTLNPSAGRPTPAAPHMPAVCVTRVSVCGRTPLPSPMDVRHHARANSSSMTKRTQLLHKALGTSHSVGSGLAFLAAPSFTGNLDASLRSTYWPSFPRTAEYSEDSMEALIQQRKPSNVYGALSENTEASATLSGGNVATTGSAGRLTSEQQRDGSNELVITDVGISPIPLQPASASVDTGQCCAPVCDTNSSALIKLTLLDSTAAAHTPLNIPALQSGGGEGGGLNESAARRNSVMSPAIKAVAQGGSLRWCPRKSLRSSTSKLKATVSCATLTTVASDSDFCYHGLPTTIRLVKEIEATSVYVGGSDCVDTSKGSGSKSDENRFLTSYKVISHNRSNRSNCSSNCGSDALIPRSMSVNSAMSAQQNVFDVSSVYEGLSHDRSVAAAQTANFDEELSSSLSGSVCGVDDDHASQIVLPLSNISRHLLTAYDERGGDLTKAQIINFVVDGKQLVEDCLLVGLHRERRLKPRGHL